MKTSCTNIHVCGTTLVIARNLFSSHKPEEKKWGKKTRTIIYKEVIISYNSAGQKVTFQKG